MMTRSGVAKRLGKSIATVRRMEGVELHPTLGGDGVHLFDPDEVEAIATGARGPSPHRIADLTARRIVDSDGAQPEAEDRIAQLESELARERAAHAQSLVSLREEAALREKQAAKEAREVASLLDSLTDRDLAALDEDDLDELIELLETAEG